MNKQKFSLSEKVSNTHDNCDNSWQLWQFMTTHDNENRLFFFMNGKVNYLQTPFRAKSSVRWLGFHSNGSKVCLRALVQLIDFILPQEQLLPENPMDPELIIISLTFFQILGSVQLSSMACLLYLLYLSQVQKLLVMAHWPYIHDEYI